MTYTYESIVAKAKALEKKKAKFDEHVAVQVNVEGEGSGIFYVEVADKTVHVEPYDYYDNDAIMTGDAENVLAYLKNKTGNVTFTGNMDKVELLNSVIPNKRAAAKRPLMLPRRRPLRRNQLQRSLLQRRPLRLLQRLLRPKLPLRLPQRQLKLPKRKPQPRKLLLRPLPRKLPSKPAGKGKKHI